MSYFLFDPTLTPWSKCFFYNICPMKNLISFRSIIRSIAVANLIITSFLGIILHGGQHSWLCSEIPVFFTSAGILLCLHVGKQSRKTALVCAALTFLSAVLGSIMDWGVCVMVVAASSCILLAVLTESLKKCGNPRSWFGEDAIWCTAQECSKLVLVAIYLYAGSVSLLLLETHFPELPILLISVAMCVLFYYRAFTGRTILMTAENEKKIMDMNRLSLRSRLTVEDENELTRLKMIYSRSENVMMEKKPFLDSSFSLEDLAVLTYCNRGQLSRAINIFSEMNFKSYLNRHRIDYALELIKKDPRLKVSELSEMSGFCTPVSFTMAFKNNVNILPSDYIREKLDEERDIT